MEAGILTGHVAITIFRHEWFCRVCSIRHIEIANLTRLSYNAPITTETWSLVSSVLIVP